MAIKVLSKQAIVEKIVADKNISKAEAARQWEYYVSLLKFFADQDYSIALPGVGRLKRKLRTARDYPIIGKNETKHVPEHYAYVIKSVREEA